MNFLDAAYEVLKQAGEPLHFTEITSRAWDLNLLDTKGQTPEATMGSRLYVDTKRPDSRFRRVSRSVFSLVEVPTSDISQRIDEINQQTRHELHKRLMDMPPDRFEALIKTLLIAIGFEEESTQLTSYTGDHGIDVRGVLNAGNITEVNAAVQVKRWKRNVQAPTVQALRGSLVVHEQGIIITTSDYSKGAQQEAQALGKTRISLVDGDKLLELLIKLEIGVTIEKKDIYSLDEEWWGDVGGGQVSILPIPAVTSQTKLAKPSMTYPISIQASAHGDTLHAELLDAKGRVRYEGVEYESPSGACQAASSWKSCNGWAFWRYQDPTSGQWRAISNLRET